MTRKWLLLKNRNKRRRLGGFGDSVIGRNMRLYIRFRCIFVFCNKVVATELVRCMEAKLWLKQ